MRENKALTKKTPGMLPYRGPEANQRLALTGQSDMDGQEENLVMVEREATLCTRALLLNKERIIYAVMKGSKWSGSFAKGMSNGSAESQSRSWWCWSLINE